MKCSSCENQISYTEVLKAVVNKNHKCSHCEVELEAYGRKSKQRVISIYAALILCLYAGVHFVSKNIGQELSALLGFSIGILIWSAFEFFRDD
jgi:uncharacterized paraquat-inducible protein A